VTTVILQGSVATRLVANFLMNSTMEKFRKSVNICQSYGQKYRGPFFDSQCIYVQVHVYVSLQLQVFLRTVPNCAADAW